MSYGLSRIARRIPGTGASDARLRGLNPIARAASANVVTDPPRTAASAGVSSDRLRIQPKNGKKRNHAPAAA